MAMTTITHAMTRDDAATARLKTNIGSTSFLSNASTVSEFDAYMVSNNETSRKGGRGQGAYHEHHAPADEAETGEQFGYRTGGEVTLRGTQEHQEIRCQTEECECC